MWGEWEEWRVGRAGGGGGPLATGSKRDLPEVSPLRKTRKPARHVGCAGFQSGGKTRNRTGDTLIFSQLLYQLSYLARRLAAREVRAKDTRRERQREF